jgi:hypothetical protein
MDTDELNRQTAINLAEKLSLMVIDVNTEVAQLRSDNAIVKVPISDLQDLLAAQSNNMEAAVRTLSSEPGVMVYKDALTSNQHFQQARIANTIKNSRNIIGSTQEHTAASSSLY